MAELNFNLLNPQTGPTAYERAQDRDFQQQLAQQQLAQSQQATKLGAARMDEMQRQAKHEQLSSAIRDIASFSNVDDVRRDLDSKLQSGELDKTHYQKIAAGLPQDNNGMHAWQTKTLRGLLSAKEQLDELENQRGNERLDNIINNRASNVQPSLAMQAPAAAPPLSGPTADQYKNVAQRLASEVNQVENPTSFDMQGVVNAYARADEAANRTNNLAPAAPANELQAQVNPLTNQQKILILGASTHKPSQKVADLMAKMNAPSDLQKLEDEIAQYKQQGVPDTDPAIATRRQLIASLGYGKDPDFPGYAIAQKQGFKGTLLDYKKAQANAERAPVQPPAPQAPVAVVDANGNTRYVRPETAIQEGLAPASTATKPLTQQQQLKLNKDRAADEGRIRSAGNTANELESIADSLLGNPEKRIPPHKGLSGITGINSMIPSMPNSPARAAQQKLDTFKGKIMALGRQIQSSEGKLGNMAVQEWKFVSDAVEKLDPAAPNFAEQLRDAVRQARSLETSMKSTFADSYETTPPANTSTQKAPKQGNAPRKSLGDIFK